MTNLKIMAVILGTIVLYGVVANAPQDSEYVWLRLDESGGMRINCPGSIRVSALARPPSTRTCPESVHDGSIS